MSQLISTAFTSSLTPSMKKVSSHYSFGYAANACRGSYRSNTLCFCTFRAQRVPLTRAHRASPTNRGVCHALTGSCERAESYIEPVERWVAELAIDEPAADEPKRAE